MDVRQRLAKILREQRIRRSLSQEQFALEAGIHRTYISDLERGARNLIIVIVDRIAKALGVQLGELLDEVV